MSTHPALGRLEQQDGLAIVARGQGFGHQLAFFKLVHRFNAALDGVLQGGQGLGLEHAKTIVGAHDQQMCAPVFDVGDNALGRRLVGWRLVIGC